MRSLIILEVEHGEDTDNFTALAEYLAGKGFDWQMNDTRIIDYTVRVDLPECFELEQ